MLRELISIIREVDPLREMSDDFSEMLRITLELTLRAGHAFFEGVGLPEISETIRAQDVRVNELQMRIRKRVAKHLSETEASPALPYCLLLVSLVKDVERIGDYAKNLCEARDYFVGNLPDDELVAELLEIRAGAETAFSLLADVFVDCDKEQALELIRRGQEFGRRCDVLVTKVARSTYDPATATAVVLGVRYYKRIGGHVLNVLSSVVMPLHKIDYYEEEFAVSATEN